MKTMWCYPLLGLVFGLLAFMEQGIAQDKETIVWLAWEQPPNFITQGKFKGQGIGDSFTQVLQNKLPQYHHENLIANARRYHRLIRQENVCVAWAWIVPGSKDFRIHSRSVSLAPGAGIQILKSKQSLFGKPGEVLSLAKLLKKSELNLGYLEEMTYSKRVQQLLDEYRGKGNIYFSSNSDIEFNLKMLDSEYVDYFFGFPSQAIYDARLKSIKNKYQFYNLEEMDKYTAMYSHCSKTEFGKKVMVSINEILTEPLLMKHLEVIERWNGQNKHYREVFINHVINQKPSQQVRNPGQ